MVDIGHGVSSIAFLREGDLATNPAPRRWEYSGQHVTERLVAMLTPENRSRLGDAPFILRGLKERVRPALRPHWLTFGSRRWVRLPQALTRKLARQSVRGTRFPTVPPFTWGMSGGSASTRSSFDRPQETPPPYLVSFTTSCWR